MRVRAVELDWIAAFQGDCGWQHVMNWFSWLGSDALGFVLPLVYFVISSRAGARLYLLCSITDVWLQVLKLGFHSPRPYWIDPRIKALGGCAGYGMPSGHTLSASIVWPSVAGALRKRWAWTAALAVVLLVSVSRVYLGVHFISDVVAAWGVAAALCWSFGRAERVMSGWLASLSLGVQMALAVWVTAVYWGIEALAQFGVGGSSSPSAFPMDARDLSWTFRSTGAFFGAVSGVILGRRWAGFQMQTALWRRVMAWGYALAGTWLLRSLCGFLLNPPSTSPFQFLGDFFGGAAGNWWVLFLAPWILLKVGLLNRGFRG